MSTQELKIKAIELAIPKVVNSLNSDELIKNAQKIYEFLTATDVPSNSSLSSKEIKNQIKSLLKDVSIKDIENIFYEIRQDIRDVKVDLSTILS